jgi:hypothetical protein
MTERYRKWGRVFRFERGCRISVDEAGEAIEEGPSFTARPLAEDVTLPAPDDDVEALAREASALVPRAVSVERLIVSSGIAEHECDGQRWRERSARLHIDLVNRQRGLRASLDLGAESCSELSLDDLGGVADALARAEGRAASPAQVILAPRVTAPLLMFLLQVDGVTLIQTAGERDGKGVPIAEHAIDSGPFPNWFRPSYRIRPVRMPFHLRAATTSTAIETKVPRAICLLRVVDRRRFEVLCDDGVRVFETALSIDRVKAVAGPSRWYPYGAGAFGSEMLL